MAKRKQEGSALYKASCKVKDCTFLVGPSKNGLGLAAQHHDRSGHSVDVEFSGKLTYVGNVTTVKKPATVKQTAAKKPPAKKAA